MISGGIYVYKYSTSLETSSVQYPDTETFNPTEFENPEYRFFDVRSIPLLIMHGTSDLVWPGFRKWS
jgi:hypothetical protein